VAEHIVVELWCSCCVERKKRSCNTHTLVSRCRWLCDLHCVPVQIQEVPRFGLGAPLHLEVQSPFYPLWDEFGFCHSGSLENPPNPTLWGASSWGLGTKCRIYDCHFVHESRQIAPHLLRGETISLLAHCFGPGTFFGAFNRRFGGFVRLLDCCSFGAVLVHQTSDIPQPIRRLLLQLALPHFPSRSEVSKGSDPVYKSEFEGRWSLRRTTA